MRETALKQISRNLRDLTPHTLNHQATIKIETLPRKSASKPKTEIISHHDYLSENFQIVVKLFFFTLVEKILVFFSLLLIN